jgi:trehalose 6-phosphate phosphatase
MKHLLAPENRHVLAQLARSSTLLAFDFDGTLASIVADRGAAGLRPGTLELLTRLCACYPCAIITGRSRSDVQARLGGAPIRYIVGNHGLESVGGPTSSDEEMAAVRPVIEAALCQHSGLDLEDKQYSLAVHYRNSPAKRRARAAIHQVVATLPVPMRVVPGKLVLNILPRGAPHKGHALLELQHREAAEMALYVGDDVTDEDVFELEHQGSLVAARVGRSKRSAAPYFLREQREVDQLLGCLLDLRPGPLPA